MSVTNGQRGNQTVLNNAFLSRTATSTSTTSIVALNNATAPSGPSVSSVQRSINAIFSIVGAATSAVYNALPTWTSTAVGTAFDTVIMRAEALTVFAGLLQTEDLTFLKLDGTRPMTAALDMGAFNIGNLADPTTNQQAATKFYVDANSSNVLANQVFS
jgi:hypothetical protein